MRHLIPPRARRSLSARAAAAPAIALAALVGLASPPPARAASEAELRGLLARYAPAVVGVKAVVKTEVQMGGQGRDQENSLDTLGVVVDPGGLIMISNTQISARRIADIMAAMGGPSDFEFNLTPTDFKVFFAGDDVGKPALLAAVDTQLDLAFLQLESPPESPLPAVDLGSGVDPEVGQEAVAISRLNRSFDYAAYFELVWVSGEVKKPRKAWLLDGEVTGLGLPIFNADGAPVGVVSTVISTVGGEGGMRSAGDMFGGINQRKTLGPVGIFLLPVKPVAKAVELSKERAKALLEEHREEGETGPPAVETPAAEEAPAAEPGGESPPAAPVSPPALRP